MAIKLTDKPNTEPISSDYPYGDIKDNIQGVQAGTPLNKLAHADFHQFFEKMMDEAGVAHNGLPDNDYSGFQLFEALEKLIILQGQGAKFYKANVSQTSTSAPTATVMPGLGGNSIGSIVWTRSSQGVYFGTLSGAFPAGKTWCNISGLRAPGTAEFQRTSNNIVRLVTMDSTTVTFEDELLFETGIEILVFP